MDGVTDNLNDALGSVIVQDTLVYRKLELGPKERIWSVAFHFPHTHVRENGAPKVSHALAHHPPVDE